MTNPPRSEHAVDTALRCLGDAFNTFDPLRFRAWAELGLTTAQLRVLFMMRQQPGVTAGELASRLAVTPPTISGIVDRLVRLELVRREEDESDRRLVRNHLTEKGDAVCGWFERGGEVFTRRILVELHHEDLQALVQGLQAFARAADHVLHADPNLLTVAMPGVNR